MVCLWLVCDASWSGQAAIRLQGLYDIEALCSTINICWWILSDGTCSVNRSSVTMCGIWVVTGWLDESLNICYIQHSYTPSPLIYSRSEWEQQWMCCQILAHTVLCQDWATRQLAAKKLSQAGTTTHSSIRYPGGEYNWVWSNSGDIQWVSIITCQLLPCISTP